MKHGAIAVLGITSLLVVTILLTSINPAFAEVVLRRVKLYLKLMDVATIGFQ
jgi:hypothetical protein